jgi:hypothetical protein
MRLHALRVQGLRAPHGIEAIPLHPEYTAIRGPAASVRGVADALLSLLDPERALERLGSERDPGTDDPARVAITLQLSEGIYRVAADLLTQKLVLARFDAEENRFVRVARAPDAARQILGAEGAPDSEVLETLAVLTLELTDDPEEEAAPVVLETPPTDHLERELREIEETLRPYAPLVESDEEWTGRIERYRAARAEGDRDLATIEQTRRELLEERARLRSGRPTRAPWFWLGAALVLYGGIASLTVNPLLGLLAGAGLLVAGTTVVGTGSRRRRMHKLDARLSALRMRERTVEKRFESEAKPVRTLLVGLGLDHIDDLESALSELRGLEERLEATRMELAASRPEPPVVPRRVRNVDARLRTLLECASRWTGETEKELYSQLRQTLPIYLSAVTGGDLQALLLDEEAGRWTVQSASGSHPFDALASEERMQVETGFQLALLERLAAVRPLPVLVGPSPPGVGEPPGLAGALARLARVVQVVQFTEGIEPWRPVAPRVHVMGDVPA